MELTETSRGFAITSFTDRYGSKCSLQKSSLATEDCIWFGVDVPFDKPDVQATRMHLTQEQVKELLPYLQRFAETGELDE